MLAHVHILYLERTRLGLDFFKLRALCLFFSVSLS